MAKHSFDPNDFAAETELLRGANTLPTLSNRLREQVLNAATSAYREARRWAQAREAAAFLGVCLLASFVLTPLANLSFPMPTWGKASPSMIDLVSRDSLSSPQQPSSAWTLRHDREFLGLPREPNLKSPISNFTFQNSGAGSQAVRSETQRVTDVSSSSLPQRDKLLTALHTSDGWGTVQAFQAVRTRSHDTLQRAFAAN